NGWAVANTTLMNERASLGGGGGSSATSLALPGSVAGHLERRAGDFVAKGGRGGTATILAGRSTKLLQNLVAELGKNDDPLIRQDLMRLYSMDQISGWGVQRAKAGQASPALPNLAKLMMSHMTRLSRDVGLRIVGPAGTVMGPDTPGAGMIQELALFSPAPSIYGGTDEVQRNIIGERVLGLPKEPGPDKATPFSELPTG
ncbi:MAG TPA: acyl-CoA dehydrogenase family protein, partial [Acidimicrobiales bacterium]|nr:acyl-CoA dehydrogenase family protein [Acidimicrobiales bacterium]